MAAAVLSGCAARVGTGGDGGGVDATVVDAIGADASRAEVGVGVTEAAAPDVPVDTTTPAECRSADDCNVRSARPSISWCRGSEGWSCLAGRCTWECEGGRTCNRGSDGCVSCIRPPMAAVVETCPSAPCDPSLGIVDGLRPSEVTCMRPDFPPAACFGQFFVDRDGQLCSWQMLPTGAIRMAVSCGICVTVYEP